MKNSVLKSESCLKAKAAKNAEKRTLYFSFRVRWRTIQDSNLRAQAASRPCTRCRSARCARSNGGHKFETDRFGKKKTATFSGDCFFLVDDTRLELAGAGRFAPMRPLPIRSLKWRSQVRDRPFRQKENSHLFR